MKNNLFSSGRISKFVFLIFVFAFTVHYAGEGGKAKSVKSVQWTDTRKAPYLIYNGNSNQMVVLWQMKSTKTCTIEWGTDTTYSLGSASTTEYNSSHQHKFVIDSLNFRTKYFYKVTAGSDVHYGSFFSAPDSNPQALNFFVYGDTRSHPEEHNKVSGAILNEVKKDSANQTLIISTGDLVYRGNYESYWDNEFFNGSYANIIKMLSEFPYLVCKGNHEKDGSLFKKYFPYPYVNSFYWSFDYGPAHFVAVDQFTSYSPGSAQYQWLENDLANSKKPWKFIYLHEPGWSAGGHGNEQDVQHYIQPLCEKYGVPIVFAGHNHYYARAVVNNIVHITTGGGGAPLYTPYSYPNIVKTAKKHHYCKIEINGNKLHFGAYDIYGAIIDTFSIVQNPSGFKKEVHEQPNRFLLKQNYPNPFNPTTVINYGLPKSSFVKLVIYDVVGHKVKTLVNKTQPAGSYNVTFDASNLSSGIYFYRLTAGNFISTKKMILLK